MNYINEAKKIAERSDIRTYLTGAIIVRNDRIVSNGWSHVPHYKLRGKRSLHAEMHALARARHLNLSGAECYIVNLRGVNGRVASAKPCLDCAIALKAAGITTAFYSHPYLSFLDLDLLSDNNFSDLKVYELNGD